MNQPSQEETMTSKVNMQDIEKEIEKIKQELIDLIDKYYPKVKPQGINQGRGEAAVIVATALTRFSTLLTKIRLEDMEEVKKYIEGVLVKEKLLKNGGHEISTQH